MVHLDFHLSRKKHRLRKLNRIFFGNFSYKNLVHAEIKNPNNYKVVSTNSKKLSISNVEYFIKEGDKNIKNGDFDKAKDSYLDARKLAKQLASFYSDLNSSFKGIDAREMLELSLIHI